MHILWTIIIGFIAGVIAKFVTPGDNEPSGFVLTTILGIVGAALANWLLSLFGVTLGGWLGYLVAGFVGACIIIFLWRAIRGRTA